MRNCNNICNSNRQLTCLYTKHKTQKRKIWQDGRLVLNTKSSKAILHDADPPPGSGDPSLDECEIAAAQLQAILQQHHNKNNDNNKTRSTTTIETERYLIEIEGPWTNVSLSTPSSLRIPKRPLNGKTMVSSSMEKLLASKFQKPKAFLPPPPSIQTSRVEQVLGKRRRPLQPGELVAKHYGRGKDSVGCRMDGLNDRRRSYNYNPQHDIRQDDRQQSSGCQIGENNGTKSPPLWSVLQPVEEQRRKQQQQFLSREHPLNRTQASFRTLEEPTSFIRSGGVEDCFGVGLADMRPQLRNAQRQRLRHPNQQRKRDASSFVSNEFDSSSYYGIDKEEEDEEEEEELTASSQAPIAVAFPQSSQARALVDGRKGKKRQNGDCNSVSNDRSNNERNQTISEAPDEGTVQTIDNIHEEEEKYARTPHRNDRKQQQRHSQLNSTYGHNNQYQSSCSSLTRLYRSSKIENDNTISNRSNNDTRSISRVHLQQHPKQNEIEPCLAEPDCHLEKSLGEGVEESDYGDDDSVDSDDGVPSSFRLKPIESCIDANKNTSVATPYLMSGNRLLSLFGAGANKQTYHNIDYAGMIGKHIKSDTTTNDNIIDNDKENSRLLGANKQGVSENTIVNNFNGKINKSYDDVEYNDNRKNDEKVGNEKQQGNEIAMGGFYLASAATSSEESSDGDDSDQD